MFYAGNRAGRVRDGDASCFTLGSVIFLGTGTSLRKINISEASLDRFRATEPK
jgi:hypothetical protein